MRPLLALTSAAFLLSACGTRADDAAPTGRASAASTTASTKTRIALGTRLDATLAVDGVHVAITGLSTRLSTRAFGREGAMREPAASSVEARDGGATIARGGLREWWTARPEGLELGYDVAARPAGDGELRVALASVGDGAFRVTSDGVAAFLESPSGARISFLDLRARDAAGRALPARFASDGGALIMAIDDRGARYPIAIDPIVATGIETKITPSTSTPGFGASLALAQDGKSLAVKNQPAGTIDIWTKGTSGWASSGSAPFPTASGGTDQYGAFGAALAFDDAGDVLAGDIRFSYSGMTWAGAVLTFSTNGTYGTAIKPTDAVHDNQFGFSVATSGTSMLVGARSTSGYASGAYVFLRSSSGWTQQVKLPQPAGTTYFGWTVAIGGDTAAVGTDTQQPFGVHRTGTTWSAATELVTSGILVGDNYGSALAAANGTVLIGAPNRKLANAGDGQVYVFTDTKGAFAPAGMMFAAPPPGESGAAAGSALAISSDGTTAFVGAPKAAGGQGRVYVLTKSGTTWSIVRTLAPSDPSVVGFGAPLALSGTALAVGAPGSSSVGGAVFVYDPALGLGAAKACVDAADCASGFCVDGVCCDAKCDGQCEACNVAGSEGTCVAAKGTPVGARTACASSEGDPTCAASCDGVTRASCTTPGASTSCGAASCDAEGRAIAAGHCDGAGACTAAMPVDCGLYLCAAGACPASCTKDGDCTSNAQCVSGACVTRTGAQSSRGDFQRCTQDGDCASGHCADGVCCNEACRDKCSSCAIPGFVGTCLPESGVDLRNDCSAASCLTTCQAGACRPVRAGDQCAPAACVDATTAAGPAVCSAAGASCGASSATASCVPYSCELGACLTSCSGSDQCASGFTCDTSSGQCVTAQSSSSGGCALGESPSSASTLGAWALAAWAMTIVARRRRRH